MAYGSSDTAGSRHTGRPGRARQDLYRFTVDRILEVTLVHGGLGGIDRFAYPGLPDEVQMLWWKEVPVPGR